MSTRGEAAVFLSFQGWVVNPALYNTLRARLSAVFPAWDETRKGGNREEKEKERKRASGKLASRKGSRTSSTRPYLKWQSVF